MVYHLLLEFLDYGLELVNVKFRSVLDEVTYLVMWAWLFRDFIIGAYTH